MRHVRARPQVREATAGAYDRFRYPPAWGPCDGARNQQLFPERVGNRTERRRCFACSGESARESGKMALAGEYRELARKCLEVARRVGSLEAKRTLIEMACIWHKLAQEREREEHQIHFGGQSA